MIIKRIIICFLILGMLVSCKASTKAKGIKIDFFDYALGMDKDDVVKKLEDAGCKLGNIMQPTKNPDAYNNNGKYNIISTDAYFWASDSEELYRFYFSEDDKLESISVLVCFDLAQSTKKIAKAYRDGYNKINESIANYISTQKKENISVKTWTESPTSLSFETEHTRYEYDGRYFEVFLEGGFMLYVFYGAY